MPSIGAQDSYQATATNLLMADQHAARFCGAYPRTPRPGRAAGYRAALAGKMHFRGHDQLHGFEAQLATDINARNHPTGRGRCRSALPGACIGSWAPDAPRRSMPTRR